MDCSKIKKATKKIIASVDQLRSNRSRMAATEVLILSDIRYFAHEILQLIEPKDKNETEPAGDSEPKI